MLNGLVAASEKQGAVAKSTGDVATALGRGNETRGDLSRAVPRPCADGADELHRACSARRRARSGSAIRSSRARKRSRREVTGPAAREGHRPQSSDRRRLRPAARSGLHRQGRAHRRRRSTGPSRSSGRAKRTSSRRSTGPSISTASQRACRTAGSRRGVTRSPVRRYIARWLPPPSRTGSTWTRSTARSIFPTTRRTFTSTYVRVEPPGVPTCFWRSVGPGPQYLRRRELRRRARARRRAGSGRLPPRAPREGAAAARLPRSRRGKGGLGKRASRAGWTRGGLPERVRLVCRGDRRGRGRRQWRDRDPPRDGRGRLRHGRQSRQRRGADPGRPHLRAHRRALQRDHASPKGGCSRATSTTIE